MAEFETKQRFLYLDGWRGVAIILVLIGHFLTSPGLNVGRLGLELFFVLSGRLMAEILFIRGTGLLEFYRRRFSRIYPALLFFVLAYTLFGVYVQGKQINGQIVAASLLFYANYMAAIFNIREPSLEHIWSLCVEEHGYVLLSLLMVIFGRRMRQVGSVIAVLAVLALANAAYQTYGLGLGYDQVYWRSDVRVASILLSASLCIYFHRHPPVGLTHYLVPLGVLGILLSIDAVPDIVKYSVGSLCFAIVVNRAGDLPPYILKILSHRLFVSFGVASFSLYLWQQPFYKGINHGLTHVTMLIGAIACGFMSYYIIENPARRWLNAIRVARTEMAKSDAA